MDVPDELTVMCGRAAYNAFVHWIGCGREHSKELLLLERIDVLTPNGKQRLRDVRDMLGQVTESVMGNLPLWADLPTGKALSRNAARGKKAFALAGQRIYVGGLDRTQLEKDGIDWDMGVHAFGAAAARSSLVAELMGCVDIPEGCDLLAGMCLMAGPVNQNDIGKTFKVLIEGESKKSDQDWKGRNSQNKMMVFPKKGQHQPGDYVYVKALEATSATLIGELVEQ